MTVQQENETTIESDALVEISNQRVPLASTPPSKADIIIKILSESETLKLIRREVKAGLTRPSKKLSTILYITQIILQSYKTALYAMKENNINITQNTNIDISQQVNELIKISRDMKKCKDMKSQASATT